MICFGLSGCYDLETEIHVLPDGSGFFTAWVRVDRKDALLATAIGGQSLGEEIDAAVENLHQAALTHKRRITVPLAREVLKAARE